MKGDRLMLYPDDLTARKLLLTGPGKSPRGNRALHCFSLEIEDATEINANLLHEMDWHLIADGLSAVHSDEIYDGNSLVAYLKEVLVVDDYVDGLMTYLKPLTPIQTWALLMSCSFFHDHANEIGRESSDPWWTMDYRLAFLGREPTHPRPEPASQSEQPV